MEVSTGVADGEICVSVEGGVCPRRTLGGDRSPRTHTHLTGIRLAVNVVCSP